MTEKSRARGGRTSQVGTWLPVGERLGRYHLRYQLATGGMGKVYLARVDGPGRFDKLVALKCIHAHLAEEPGFVEMFLDEARIAARITHPHVCSVFDFGCEDGVYYIAMEYLVGQTVSKLVRRLAHLETPPPSTKVAAFGCRIIVQAAEGLHAAHELKGDDGEDLRVVHRDVSPQNLLVGYDGNVQVMDFGIATAAGRLHTTQTGSLKGKIAYMAPEQLDRRELDRRADVWGLGVVLWEWLTGRRLFRRRSELDTVVALAQGTIQPPSVVEEDLPKAFDDVVMRALARDPDDRYPTARHFAVDLSRLMNRLDEPVGVPELAQWMEELFSEERAHSLALVDQARRSSPSAIAEPLAPPADDVSSSRVRVFESEADALSAVENEAREAASSWEAEPVAPSDEATTEVTPAPTPAQLGSPPAGPVLAPRPLDAPPVTVAAAREVDPGEGFVSEPAWLGSDGSTELEPRSKRTPLVAGAALLSVAIIAAIGIAAATGGDAEVTVEAESAPTPDQGPPRARDEPTAVVPMAETERGDRAPALAEAASGGMRADEPSATSHRRRRVRTRSATRRMPAMMRAAMTQVAMTQTATMQAARARATGTVAVVALGGWADVYEGNRRLGRTPARVDLSAGRHTLRLRPFGRGPGVRRTVDVRAGAVTNLAVPIAE